MWWVEAIEDLRVYRLSLDLARVEDEEERLRADAAFKIQGMYRVAAARTALAGLRRLARHMTTATPALPPPQSSAGMPAPSPSPTLPPTLVASHPTGTVAVAPAVLSTAPTTTTSLDGVCGPALATASSASLLLPSSSAVATDGGVAGESKGRDTPPLPSEEPAASPARRSPSDVDVSADGVAKQPMLPPGPASADQAAQRCCCSVM